MWQLLYDVAVECFCCGQERDGSSVVGLRCHPEVVVCRECIAWLNGRAGGVDVTPTLPVANMDEAVAFCVTAGFTVETYDDGFAFVQLDGQSVFDLDMVPTLVAEENHAGCYIIVNDVDAWHARLVSAGLMVSALEDMPWGMHEFRLTDPSGNNIRIGRSIVGD